MVDHNMDVHQKVFKGAKKESRKKSRLTFNFVRKRNYSSSPPKFKCDKGDFATNSEILFQQHTEKEHKLKCGHCEFAFVTHKVYARHLAEVHQKTKPPKDQACQFCPYVTAFQANLQKHVRGKHSKEASYHCNLCDFGANWSNMLKDHKIKVHCTQEGEASIQPKPKRGRPRKQLNTQ